MSAAAEARATHVRRAVEVVRDDLGARGNRRAFEAAFLPRWEPKGLPHIDEPWPLRAAWALANIVILHQLTEHNPTAVSLPEYERWFHGKRAGKVPVVSDRLSDAAEAEALRQLSHVSYDDNLRDLLPYVLDPHGPGSRLSVMRDPATAVARTTKRSRGVFYTPADVAEYMVDVALGQFSGDEPSVRCLDPASGTGVFLVAFGRAVAAKLNGPAFNRFEHLLESSFGIDISALSVESCAFVLLHECASDALRLTGSLWAAWHAIRLNLAAVDALHVGASQLKQRRDHWPAAADKRLARAALLRGVVAKHGQAKQKTAAELRPDTRSLFAADCVDLATVFPEAVDGFHLVIGNPPYADLVSRQDEAFLLEQYKSLRGGASSGRQDMYPLFIEMMWRLARRGKNAAALVVPLSIAYHRGRQFAACRTAMSENGGLWRCAFFDREPHALFGEDVKTRSAILFRFEDGGDETAQRLARFEVGPLRKWTSRTRNQLFSSITFTPLKRLEAREGLPRIDGSAQADAFERLASREHTIARMCARIGSCAPTCAYGRKCDRTIFVGSTAYNFLNVFRGTDGLVRPSATFSENSVHELELIDAQRCAATLAILSSRMVFWLWHVTCDGFHVPRRFIESIPFDDCSFCPSEFAQLAEAGEDLWRGLLRNRILSKNGGRVTIAYRPFGLEAERDRVDRMLINVAGLRVTFLDELRRFVRQTVVVDETDGRRRHLADYFREREIG